MIRYARGADGGHIAYEALGDFEPVLLLVSDGFIPIDTMDAEPRLERSSRRLTQMRRLVRFDRRGVGASDPLPDDGRTPLEAWVDDAVAVLDAVGAETAAVFGSTETALIAMALAGRHPHRVDQLVLVNCTARMTSAPDYPIGAEGIGDLIEGMTRLEHSDDVDDTDDTLEVVAPSAASDPRFRRWWRDAGRRGASPAEAQRLLRALAVADVRADLPSITASTVVIRRAEDPIVPRSHPRYVADLIPNARYVEVPGADDLWWVGEADSLLDVVEELLTGSVGEQAASKPFAVLFTDLVGSTERAQHLGDRAWSSLLDSHDQVVRRCLARSGGRERNTTGDGFLATFAHVEDAVRAATSIRDGLRALDLDVRCAVHRGAVEDRGHDVAGLAVHVAARVLALADAGEILLTGDASQEVAAGYPIRDRGSHTLKGVPGTWALHAVDDPSTAG